MSKFAIHFRKRIEVNTDPQRRCYNGCHFSSEMVWTGWSRIYALPTLEDAEQSIVSYKAINPSYEYRIEEEESV